MSDATVGAVAAALRTEVRDSLRGMDAAWDSLVDRSPLPSPFLRSWWLEGVAGPRPVFVLVFRNDRLVGGAAFERDRVLGVERLRAAGFRLDPDHLDLVADPAHVEDVVGELRAWLTRRGARIIDLVGLAEGARIIDSLPAPVRQAAFDQAPWSPLPPSLDEYLEQRPRELLRLIGQPRRRLERAGAEHRVVGAEDAQAALERFRRLHEAQWGDRSDFLPEFDRFARAGQEGIARGELVVRELWVDGDVVATHVCFVTAGRLSDYQAGRDGDRRWRGAGTWLTAVAVGDACERGCHEYDFLRGAEPYKEQWASNARSLVRAAATSGWRARLVAALLRTRRRAQEALRRSRVLG
jgi:CelD/BcsL family acetyltransferase involved in cellulose biosynthesis